MILTGASRGIGAATARLAAKDGYAVAVNYNSSEAEAEAGGVASRPDHPGGVVGNAAGVEKHQLPLRQVLTENLEFYLRHYQPEPLQGVQREFH